MNSTFIYEDDSHLTFDQYLDLQEHDEDSPQCSTFNKFNAPIDFDMHLRTYSQLSGLQDDSVMFLSTMSGEVLQCIGETTMNFILYLNTPFTTRFRIRYDRESFFLFCNSKNYSKIYLEQTPKTLLNTAVLKIIITHCTRLNEINLSDINVLEVNKRIRHLLRPQINNLVITLSF